MPKDAELVMRSGEGNDPNMDATEAGVTSLTPAATNGAAVIELDKTALKGVPISIIVPASASSTDKTASHAFVIHIEVSDTLGSNWERVLTMQNTTPATPVGYFAGKDDNAKGRHTAMLSTQRKYARYVATLTGTCDLKAVWIGVDPGAMPTQ